jgi:hypothetical protein
MIRECDGDVPEIVERLSRRNRWRMARTKSLKESAGEYLDLPNATLV